MVDDGLNLLIDGLAQRWERAPALFKRPLAVPLMGSEEIWPALLAVAEAAVSQAGPARLAVFREGGQVICDVAAHLPQPSDGSLEAYGRRLEHAFGGERYGLTANGFHAAGGTVERRMRNFLRRLYGAVGFSTEPVETPAFFGNQRVSAFGAHTDEASVISFVLAGRKRYRLFSYDVLAGAREAHFSSAYGPYLDRAVTFEAESGDVVYWPSSYWHVADMDGDDRSWSFVASVAVFVRPHPGHFFTDAIRRVIMAETYAPGSIRTGFPPGVELPSALRMLVDGDGSSPAALGPRLALEARRLWLEHVSNAGLAPTGRVENDLPRDLEPATLVTADPDERFLFAEHGDRLIVAHEGRSLVWPHRRFLVSALQILGEAHPVVVEELARRAGHPDAVKIVPALLRLGALRRV